MSGAQAKQPPTRAMKHDPICSMSDCDRAYYAKGFCRLHWERNHLNGGPMIRKALVGDSVEARLKHYSTPSGTCMVWVGHRNRDGYGTIKVDGSTRLAHRVAFEVAHGPIGNGLLVRHRCDNPPCIRLDHLELGTNRDNQQDKTERRRSTYGELNPGAKLTETQVQGIRKALSQGATHKEVAARFGCSKTTVGRIRRRESWAYLEAK